MGFIYTAFTSRIPNCEVTILNGELVLTDEQIQQMEDFMPADDAVQTDGTGQEEEQPEVIIPHSLPLIASRNNDGWGCVKKHDFFSEMEFPMPIHLNLRYLADGVIYNIDAPLDTAKLEEMWKEQAKGNEIDAFKDIVVGTAPFGVVALWLQSRTRSKLVQTFQAEKAVLNEMEEAIYGDTEESEYHFIEKDELESDMRQYNIKYVPLEEYWDTESNAWVEYNKEDLYYDDMDIESIEDQCADGTFNYMDGDNKQLKYHQTGRPDRITIKWNEGRNDFMAHFYFSKSLGRILFDQCFGDQPDDKIDLMVRLDTQRQKYGLALRSKSMFGDFEIPWHAYQLIVFRGEEEHYKSPNCTFEPGEWCWF